MTLAEMLALLLGIETMDDDALDQLQTDLSATAAERLAADPTDEVLADLDSIADALAAISAESTRRDADLAERMSRRDAAAARIAEATTPAAEAEPEIEVEAEPLAAVTDLTPEPEPVVEAEPIAASTVTTMPRVTRAVARRPKSAQPRPSVTAASLPGDIEDWGLHASASQQSMAAGARIRTLDELGTIFGQAIEAGMGSPVTSRTVQKLVSGGSYNVADLYPNDRILGSDPYSNQSKLNAVVSPRAIAAAGGICAPPMMRYDLPIIAGSEARPVRDSLTTRFGADRGAVTTMGIPVIEDAAAGIGTWTNTQDITPGNNTKTCMTIGCPDPHTSTIQAITSCLRLGNFKARYFGELIQDYISLLAVNQARTAETIAIGLIGAGSTQVNTGTVLGTTRDILATIDRSVAALESRFRAENLPLRLGLPQYLLEQIRVDLTRQMPVGTLDETLAVADAKIEGWFRMRGVNVTWLLDGEAGQVFATQLDGPLVGWPTNVIGYLFPEGTWLFLDGGSLDFGIVRDSVLNATNEFQIFSETMETVHKHGTISWRLSMDVCPDGSASALVDIDPCATGS